MIYVTEKRPPVYSTVLNFFLSSNPYAVFVAAFVVAFFTVRAGRDLPKLPIAIFPFFVRLSPLPMIF